MMKQVNIENQVIEIADAIAARKFRYEYSDKEYRWLTEQCTQLCTLLEEAKAEPMLVKELAGISRDLEAQNEDLTHDLVRQQTLIYNQDAILFNLMKEGYHKMLRY